MCFQGRWKSSFRQLPVNITSKIFSSYLRFLLCSSRDFVFKFESKKKKKQQEKRLHLEIINCPPAWSFYQFFEFCPNQTAVAL